MRTQKLMLILIAGFFSLSRAYSITCDSQSGEIKVSEFINIGIFNGCKKNGMIVGLAEILTKKANLASIPEPEFPGYKKAYELNFSDFGKLISIEGVGQTTCFVPRTGYVTWNSHGTSVDRNNVLEKLDQFKIINTSPWPVKVANISNYKNFYPSPCSNKKLLSNIATSAKTQIKRDALAGIYRLMRLTANAHNENEVCNSLSEKLWKHYSDITGEKLALYKKLSEYLAKISDASDYISIKTYLDDLEISLFTITDNMHDVIFNENRKYLFDIRWKNFQQGNTKIHAIHAEVEYTMPSSITEIFYDINHASVMKASYEIHLRGLITYNLKKEDYEYSTKASNAFSKLKIRR